MDERDLKYWLALCRAPGLGPLHQKALLKHFDNNIEAVFNSEKSELLEIGIKSATIDYLHSPDWKNVDLDFAWLQKSNNHLLTILDTNYPCRLADIDDAPVILFINGDPALLDSDQIAIVGSRNPSVGGRRTAFEFSRLISQLNITVTSGLAMGIDYCGHLGALESGNKTIAVMGHGLDMVYPAKHSDIAERISEQGALVSEFPVGIKPIPGNFPRRNRIISGLSSGVLVVEAAIKSGSLITARFAMEYGREVFAIPGSIKNPLAKGCHKLIKQGAKLVEEIEDILEELAGVIHINLQPKPGFRNQENNTDYEAEYLELLNKMGFDAVSIDYLTEQTGLTTAEVSSMLLILELEGLVTSRPGGQYERIK